MSESLYQRIISMFRPGVVLATRDDGPVQRLQVQVSSMEIRDNVINTCWWGFASRPLPGGQVLVSVPGGNASGGFVVSSGDTRYHFALSEGECAIYDDLGQSVHLTRTGITIDGGGLPIQVQNAPTITMTATTNVRLVTPLLEVTGDILDNCDTQPHTNANFRTIYNSHTHKVEQVQAGGSTIETDIPDQQD